ncbi:MAG: hypothetical protein ACR2PX_06470 [Endozoicomonas sp.]
MILLDNDVLMRGLAFYASAEEKAIESVRIRTLYGRLIAKRFSGLITNEVCPVIDPGITGMYRNFKAQVEHLSSYSFAGFS